jgi:hypothetical protein
MNFAWYARSSSINLFLLLEWVLLGVAAFIQILVAIGHTHIGIPILNMLGIAIFGAMRSIFPHRWSHKLLYTAAEFGLLILLTFWGDFPLPSLLYVVLTMRNCVLLPGEDRLESRVRSIVTLLAFLLCLLTQAYRLWAGRMFFPVPPAQIGTVGVNTVRLSRVSTLISVQL